METVLGQYAKLSTQNENLASENKILAEKQKVVMAVAAECVDMFGDIVHGEKDSFQIISSDMEELS